MVLDFQVRLYYNALVAICKIYDLYVYHIQERKNTTRKAKKDKKKSVDNYIDFCYCGFNYYQLTIFCKF